MKDVGLKLKPSKCKFAQCELEYLGHIVSPDGLNTNPRLIAAVQDFPTPQSVHDVRRFLGLASYYRRFICNFARIARPLHQLTRKGAEFVWAGDCEEAFRELKKKLTTAPVLAYPDFSHDFVLETDASVQGIGAVLGQYQKDHKLHPVAYASKALSHAEERYGITELETLAVVSHFHHYLYGNTVTVFTDHTAVKAVLETPNPSAKHARWWSRVYGRGVKEVKIVYRPGRENKNADALSRHPQLPAPTVGIAEDEVQVFPITAEEGRDEVTPTQLSQEVAEVGLQAAKTLTQNHNPVTQLIPVKTTLHSAPECADHTDLPILSTVREQCGNRHYPEKIQAMSLSQQKAQRDDSLPQPGNEVLLELNPNCHLQEGRNRERSQLNHFSTLELPQHSLGSADRSSSSALPSKLHSASARTKTRCVEDKTLTTDGDQEGIWRKLPLVAEDQSNPANRAITELNPPPIPHHNPLQTGDLQFGSIFRETSSLSGTTLTKPVLPQLTSYCGAVPYSGHSCNPPVCCGSAPSGINAVNHMPSKISISGQTPTTAAVQTPAHSKPPNGHVALRLGTSTPAADKMSTTAAREECSLQMASTRIPSKTTHENDLTASASGSTEGPVVKTFPNVSVSSTCSGDSIPG